MINITNEQMDKASHVLLLIGAIIAVVAVSYATYTYFNKPSVVEMTPEQIAQPKEVQTKAKEAGVTLDDDQAETVSKTITEGKATYTGTVKATPQNYKDVATKAQKASGSDYSILTNKSTPKSKSSNTGQSVASESISSNESDNSIVNIDQYNVFAYKKVLRSIEYDPVNKEADFVIQRKITNDGKYIGVGAGYNFDNQKVVAKIVYTW